MSEIATAEIRRKARHMATGWPEDRVLVSCASDLVALCDALDEARSERNELIGIVESDDSAFAAWLAYGVERTRAEKAEADAEINGTEANRHMAEVYQLRAKIARVQNLQDAWNASIATMHLAKTIGTALDES